MTWRCPACQSQIRHGELERHPSPGAVYRCSVCRLELKLDPLSNKLIVVPMAEDDAPGQRPRKIT